MKRILLAAIAAVLCLSGCHQSTGVTKVSATGSIYECLVVCPKTLYPDVEVVMGADMPCLPQMEPYFNLTHVSNSVFDDFLKSTRNILMVDISAERYSQTKVKYIRDQWSTPQAYCRIQAPCVDSMLIWWMDHGEQVRDWFVREEIRRQDTFLKASTNKQARQALKATMGVDMWIPQDYMLIMDTTNFVWCCNNKGPMRRDLVVYKYPYTDTNTFTLPYLCAKRDEVLGPKISASVPGSYMGTEYKIFPPQMRALSVQNHQYAAEIRGLWKMQGGEAMGGPYVSHTRVDEVNGQIVTAEVFVYAAGQRKRNALRQAEAILYTLELPQDTIRSAN